jgi:hypothetical protein
LEEADWRNLANLLDRFARGDRGVEHQVEELLTRAAKEAVNQVVECLKTAEVGLRRGVEVVNPDHHLEPLLGEWVARLVSYILEQAGRTRPRPRRWQGRQATDVRDMVRSDAVWLLVLLARERIHREQWTYWYLAIAVVEGCALSRTSYPLNRLLEALAAVMAEGDFTGPDALRDAFFNYLRGKNLEKSDPSPPEDHPPDSDVDTETMAEQILNSFKNYIVQADYQDVLRLIKIVDEVTRTKVNTIRYLDLTIKSFEKLYTLITDNKPSHKDNLIRHCQDLESGLQSDTFRQRWRRAREQISRGATTRKEMCTELLSLSSKLGDTLRQWWFNVLGYFAAGEFRKDSFQRDVFTSWQKQFGKAAVGDFGRVALALACQWVNFVEEYVKRQGVSK